MTATQQLLEPVAIGNLSRYVDEVLNSASEDPLEELFTPTFCDHHPLRIPGLLEPRGPKGTIRDLRSVVKILRSPLVNLAFVLEDVIPGSDRLAYRLFGQGTIQLSSEPLTMLAGRHKAPTVVRSVDLPGVKLRVKASGWEPGKILGDRLTVVYSCVGIFELSGSRFSARWGPEVLD